MANKKKKWWKKFLPAAEGVFCLLLMAGAVATLLHTQPNPQAPITSSPLPGSALTNVVVDESLEALMPPGASLDVYDVPEIQNPANVRVVSHTSAE